jgi:hypothetical protein
VKKNDQSMADNKNDVESFDNGEINQKNNRAKWSLQKKKASEWEINMSSTKQKQSHASAVPEEKKKRESVSESEIGK